MHFNTEKVLQISVLTDERTISYEKLRKMDKIIDKLL